MMEYYKQLKNNRYQLEFINGTYEALYFLR